jgi:hypothetical protein
MLRALRAEISKLKRSRMPLWTALIVLLLPLIVVGIDSAPHAPAIAWADFMRVGSEMLATLGVLIFGMVAAYLFGRDYVEGTAPSVLTLPMRREYPVLAKGIVLLAWVVGLTMLSVGAGAGYAALLGLKGFTLAGLATTAWESLQVALLLFGTLPIVALLAVVGRGYIAPMAFSGMTAWVGLGLAEAGWSRWFPWSMPMGITGIVLGPPIEIRGLVSGSWAVMAAMFVAGVVALVWYVDTADVREG